ncbi:hypothetical protein J437_LFUL002764 [Ladona fulva]|uniref:DUF1736 domain-containing protein n=1 Tax=Ladona fulva TaxID=123851 RepID=A0A8K0JU32_LADFU|nr:hypothetical protein J437_LFUL002764 [Ladona fulva]
MDVELRSEAKKLLFTLNKELKRDIVLAEALRRRRTVCESLLVLGAALAFILHLRLAVVTGGLSSAAPRFAAADNPAAAPSSGPLTRLLTFAFLPAFNFGLLLLPRRLSFDWSMDAVPRLSSLGDPRNVVSLFFYAALLRIAIRSASRLARSKQQSLQKIQRPYRRPPRTHRQGHRGPCNGTLPLTAAACSSCKGSVLHYHQRCLGNNNNNNHLVSSGTKHISSQTIPTESAPCCTCCCPMLVLGPRRLRRCVPLPSQESSLVPHQSLGPSELVLVTLAMLALPFLPASNLFFHVGFVVAERVLYLPSAGYCILVAIGAKAVWGRFVRTRTLRMVLLCGVLVLLVSMGARTVRRNRDWQDEESLYRSGIAVNPPKEFRNVFV